MANFTFSMGDQVILNRSVIEADNDWAREIDRPDLWTEQNEQVARLAYALESLNLVSSTVIGFAGNNHYVVDSSHEGDAIGVSTLPGEWLMLAPDPARAAEAP